MKLETPVRTLGTVDHRALKAAAASVPAEAWLEDPLRQKSFEQHRHTQSIILLFANGWPKVQVERRPSWALFSEAAIPVMQQIVAAHYKPGGVVIRAMVAKLLPGGEISEHFDSHETFAISHRIHVPLQTNPDVEFRVRGDNHHLVEGVAYEISNLDFHAVNNRSPHDRLHFIFDYTTRLPEA